MMIWGFVAFILGIIGGGLSMKRVRATGFMYSISGAVSICFWGIQVTLQAFSNDLIGRQFSIFDPWIQTAILGIITMIFSVISLIFLLHSRENFVNLKKSQEQANDSTLLNTKKLIGRKQKQLTEAKIQVQNHYSSLRDAYGVRLLSLVAGLFTLSQIYLTINDDLEANVFSFPHVFRTISPNMEGVFKILYSVEWWVFSIVFFSLFILSFFIIRSFFKFSLCCYYSDHALWIKKEDLENLPDKYGFDKIEEIFILIQETIGFKMAGQLKNCEDCERKKIYGIIPYDVFIPGSSWARQRWGYFVCFLFAFISVTALYFVINNVG
jgi:hypothetical protein